MKNGPIIIADDDTDDQELFLNAFKNLGLQNEIKIFDNGKKTYEFLLETPAQPFIIICDLNMPVMNGLELRKQICKNDYLKRKSIPFIFLSTTADPKFVAEAYMLDVQGFFVKERSYEGIQEQIKQIAEYWQKCKHPNC